MTANIRYLSVTPSVTITVVSVTKFLVQRFAGKMVTEHHYGLDNGGLSPLPGCNESPDSLLGCNGGSLPIRYLFRYLFTGKANL